MPDNIHTSANY